MRAELKKLFHILPFFFNIAARSADQTKLSRHIINLNQQNSVQSIISSMSVCLKEMINYKLFAFAIKGYSGIDVWLDPRMYRKSMESVFITDFDLTDRSAINYLNHDFQHGEKEYHFSLENLISYKLDDDLCQGRIYMLPNRNMPEYHDDIVSLIIKSTEVALAKQINIDRLTNAATIDPLTGCYNRREFEEQMVKNIAGSKRHKRPLSVFMFDIDHFKRVNDTYGHQAGDAVLKSVASTVKNNMRTGDILARYGGEEFIAILPSTGKREAMELADRLRQIIANGAVMTESRAINITASFGIASLDPSISTTDSEDVIKLIEQADSMMYKAKINGRNTIMPGLIQLCAPASKSTGTI